MKIFGFNSEKKRSEIALNNSMARFIEKKSDAFSGFLDSFLGDSNTGGFKKISIGRMFEYYECCAPLFTAIRIIAREGATITPVLKNKETGEIEKNHELLTFLETPNGAQTAVKFFREYISFDLLTGNTFLSATGAINKPAMELFNVSPNNVVGEQGDDGLTETYNVTPTNSSLTFVFMRKEDMSTEGIRYFNSAADKEIWHAKQFNPRQDVMGMSPLTAMFYDIEQWISSSNHNKSLLEKGGRLSLALFPDGILTQDQNDVISQQLDQNHTGSSNAGRMMMMQGIKSIQDLGQSNKDMDWSAGKQAVTESIYTTLNIPLPLISPAHQNFSNFGFATIALYKNAVLPQVSDMFAEIGRLLLPRYKDGDKFNLTFVEAEIGALKSIEIDTAKVLKDIGVSSINEIRKKLGEEEIRGGDDVFIPGGTIAVGSGIQSDAIPINDDIAKGLNFSSKESYQRFIAIISDNNGKLMLNNEQIHDLLRSAERARDAA